MQELQAREAIRHTMARYTHSGDRLLVDDFVAVFTEDGILQSDGVPAADEFYYRGREDIARWLTRWTRQAADSATPTHGASFVRHHLSTSLIELTGADTARARTYWTAYTDIGPDHCGVYLDQFQQCDEQWLIAQRKVRMDWRSPDSLFTTAISRSG
jgi:hypothetical protein